MLKLRHLNTTGLKQRLREFLPKKQIDELCRKTRSLRKWNYKTNENKYLARRLRAILITYHESRRTN